MYPPERPDLPQDLTEAAEALDLEGEADDIRREMESLLFDLGDVEAREIDSRE